MHISKKVKDFTAKSSTYYCHMKILADFQIYISVPSRCFLQSSINMQETHAGLHLFSSSRGESFCFGWKFSDVSFGKAYEMHFQKNLVSLFLCFRD